ncbi:MAG: HNH endonuclease [Alphaproteobacteria bacterium]|nr:HNH endonuclease [Alphaproteobacteria bacterium]
MKKKLWTNDELILSMALYLESKSKYKDIPANAPELQDLSDLFRKLYISLGEQLTEKTRSAKSIYARMQNFKSVDPDYLGKGLVGGGKGFRNIWNEYYNNQQDLFSIANSIKKNLMELSSEKQIKILPPAEFEEEAFEGRLLSRIHNYKERNKKIVKTKKEWAMDNFGKLECESCNFDFAVKYGILGTGFIECHHIKPISSLHEKSKTKLEDLALVCSNCHRMIHRKKPWKTIQEMKSLTKI